jgi:hypothetical protein
MVEPPHWVTSILWPGAVAADGWTGRSRLRMVANPSVAAPRQLMPWTVAAAVGASTRATDDRARRRSLLDGAGALGLVAIAPFDRGRRMVLKTSGDSLATDSLIGHMRSEIDPTIANAIVMCGPMRANQKPVLQLLDRWGRTRAFVKVGWNALTTSLMHAELRALEHLATVDRLEMTIPRVLGAGEYGAGEWLAISPVGVRRRLAPSHDTMLRSARAIESSAAGWVGSLGDSTFARDLLKRASALPSSGPAVGQLVDQRRDRKVTTGAAHGDFVPWNILSGVPRPAVWDWERYATDIPVGFDRLHYALQVELFRMKRRTSDAVGAVTDRLAHLLPEMDEPDAELTLDCYLAHVLCRYEHDAAQSGVQTLATRAAELATVLHQRGRAQ